MSLRHQKNIKKGAKMEPKTSHKRLPKSIAKSDGKNEVKHEKVNPFWTPQKVKSAPRGPKKKSARRDAPRGHQGDPKSVLGASYDLDWIWDEKRNGWNEWHGGVGGRGGTHDLRSI